MEHIAPQQLVVLLVEPSMTQRRIVSGFLRQLGVGEVLVAESGRIALQRLRAEDPDLVISALYLPDMTGTDLIHEIRADRSFAEKAFILISSETRFRYLEPIRQAGVIAILPKPFGVEELRLALNNTLQFLGNETVRLGQLEVEEVEVLIVDDSAMARKHVRRVLSSMGLERFTEARDGREALALMDERFFDVVVTDYNMPNMDGKELVEHIRGHSGQASVPILMVTSEHSEGRLAAVQQAGVSAICDKPFEAATVRHFLQQVFAAA